MKNYELAVIVNGKSTPEEKEKLISKIKGIIEEAGGKTVKVDDWGKKTFYFRIQKQSEGIYLLFSFSLEPKDTTTIKKRLTLEEKVIRYLFVEASEGR